MDDKTQENKHHYEWYRARHMALWRWLAKNPGKEKYEWPGWSNNGGQSLDDTINGCFACEYTADNEYHDHECERCPIQWTFPDGPVAEDCECSDDDGCGGSVEYVRWYTSKGVPQIQAKYAQKIAGMWPEWDDRHHKDEDGTPNEQ